MLFVQTSWEEIFWIIDEFLAWNSIYSRIKNAVCVNACGHWNYTVIGPHILNESQSVDFTVPVHVYIYIYDISGIVCQYLRTRRAYMHLECF